MTAYELRLLAPAFSACKLQNAPSAAEFARPYCFYAHTDNEISLVCPTERAPDTAISREDGLRAFRVKGALDFSLVGILSRISSALAEAGIAVFAISTYDTDYVLIREERLADAAKALKGAGYALTGGWEDYI